jgi:hypothetical protein
LIAGPLVGLALAQLRFMKPTLFLSIIDNKWRARRIAKLLALGASRADNRRYYQAIYDYTFFIVTTGE